jgi:hypothetical protein
VLYSAYIKEALLRDEAREQQAIMEEQDRLRRVNEANAMVPMYIPDSV